jgi:hypothetical protein
MMTDNEFDDLFSEKVRNARSVIQPEEQDWQSLSSHLDRFQSRKRFWFSLLPWLVLLLISAYTARLTHSLHDLQQKIITQPESDVNELPEKDTVLITKEIYIKDTIYTYPPSNMGVRDFKSGNPMLPPSFSNQEDSAVANYEEQPIRNRMPWESVDFIGQGGNLSVSMSPHREMAPLGDLLFKKGVSKVRMKSSIGLSAGTLIPFQFDEIKNPVAMELHSEFNLSSRVSMRPSILAGFYFFETEDVNAVKSELSILKNPQGSLNQAEIKGTDKIIMPAVSFQYKVHRTMRMHLYSGIGLAAMFHLPGPWSYDFQDPTNNNVYRYKVLDEAVSSSASLFGNFGGKMYTKSSFTIFGELRSGISKSKTLPYTPFMAALAGVSYTF